MAACTVTTAKGACKMAALRGQTTCFAHSPTAAAARSAARRKGGASKRGSFNAPATAPSDSTVGMAPPSAGVPFELGELTEARDIGPALLRLAHAIGRGAVDPKRGRLLAETLRAASFAFTESGGGSGEKVRRGWHSLTDAQLDRFKLTGKLPPGVTIEDLDRPS